jgi:hypothetical protein
MKSAMYKVFTLISLNLEMLIKNVSEEDFWVQAQINTPRKVHVCKKSFRMNKKTEYILRCEMQELEEGDYKVIISSFRDSSYTNLVQSKVSFMAVYESDIEAINYVKEIIFKQ